MTVQALKSRERLELLIKGHVFRDWMVLYADGSVEIVERIFKDYNGKIRIDHKCNPGIICFSRYRKEDFLGDTPKITILD